MIGQTVSHFRVVERIGSGAMGDVYLAEDTNLQRRVALKFLSRGMTDNKQAVERFLREAHATSALDHPNICTIYETGETSDGEMFIAMAYYEGGNVKTLVDDGPMSVADAVASAAGVADGLDKAHDKKIFHRDIKPANLMMTKDGIVKVVDFGIAKLSGLTKVTRTGMTLGTLAYMSPEQTRGKDFDGRSDVFSLGVTLYEMLTGELPFWADNEAALVYLIGNEDAKPLRTVRGDVPETLERVVARALEKDPDDRYASMAEFRDALFDVLRDIAPGQATRLETMLRTATHQVQSHAGRMLAIAVVVVFAIAAVVYRGKIACMLGLCGLGTSKGVAVLPLHSGTKDPTIGMFAAGLAIDLTHRAERLAALDSDLWVVPPHRVQKDIDPSRAAELYGVDAVITGTVESDRREIRLRLADAKSGTTIRSLLVTVKEETPWQVALSERLAELLEVDAPPSQITGASAGYTDAPEAYTSFVTGLGYLSTGQADRFDPAIKALDDAVAQDSSFAEAYVQRCRAFFEKGQSLGEDRWMDDAVDACEQALQIRESSAGAYEWLGRIESLRGNKEAAAVDLTRAAVMNPRDAVARNRLGWTYFELGRYDKAEEVYAAAIQVNPFYWGGYEDLGYLMYVQGRYDEAIEQFERVAALAPAHAPTYNYLGVLYFRQERWPEATVSFEKSFELGKNSAACGNLGTLYYMDGRFEDAARMYEWAWEYNRKSYIAVGNLASTLLWIPGQRARASELFGEAIALAEKQREEDPDDVVLVALLGGYYAVDDPDTGVELAEQAAAMDPDDAEVWFRAATTYEYIGQNHGEGDASYRAKALVLLGRAIEKGYSVKMIEHEQVLEDLRRDPRYRMLVSGKETPDTQ